MSFQQTAAAEGLVVDGEHAGAIERSGLDGAGWAVVALLVDRVQLFAALNPGSEAEPVIAKLR